MQCLQLQKAAFIGKLRFKSQGQLKEVPVNTDIHVNTAEIPPEIRYQLAKGFAEFFQELMAQPGAREQLDAWKAAHPQKRKEK